MGIPNSPSAPSNLFRKLSSAFLVNTAEFQKASATDMTATMAQAGTLPVVFVENFMKFRDKKAIIDKLLRGEDVTVELEFNDISLSRDELAAIQTVRPVLDKISGMEDSYPWVGGNAFTMTFGKTMVRRNDYSISYTRAKVIWDKASRYWAGLSDRPKTHNTAAGGYNYRDVVYGENEVKIGCQTIPRVDVEAVALQRGWEPNIY